MIAAQLHHDEPLEPTQFGPLGTEAAQALEERGDLLELLQSRLGVDHFSDGESGSQIEYGGSVVEDRFFRRNECERIGEINDGIGNLARVKEN
ncbi:MAG: hypothetical protein HC897_18680 [Thermoanaerobaculia bacterium]|nr:hypothetical protein [Thermoanaerobaculia bacterium]